MKWYRPAADGEDASDERAGNGEVSETTVKRGIVPSPSSLRGAQTGPCVVSGDTERR